MQIKDSMTHNSEVVRPDELLQEVAEKMEVLEVGALPVCDGDQLIGLLTDRDITVRATAAGCDPAMTQVCDVMSTNLVYCFEDQDVTEAAKLVEVQQVRRLPVLNRHHRLVGIVSLDDLATGGDVKLAGETLKEVSKLTGPQSGEVTEERRSRYGHAKPRTL
jgi:CBS domain-containing protein